MEGYVKGTSVNEMRTLKFKAVCSEIIEVHAMPNEFLRIMIRACSTWEGTQSRRTRRLSGQME